MKYIATTKKLLGIGAVRADYAAANSEDADLILFGKYGMIWQYSKDSYMVVCDSARVANKHFNLTKDNKIKDGEEIGRILSKSDSLEWVKLLKVPRSRPGQVKLAKTKYGW